MGCLSSKQTRRETPKTKTAKRKLKLPRWKRNDRSSQYVYDGSLDELSFLSDTADEIDSSLAEFCCQEIFTSNNESDPNTDHAVIPVKVTATQSEEIHCNIIDLSFGEFQCEENFNENSAISQKEDTNIDIIQCSKEAETQDYLPNIIDLSLNEFQCEEIFLEIFTITQEGTTDDAKIEYFEENTKHIENITIQSEDFLSQITIYDVDIPLFCQTPPRKCYNIDDDSLNFEDEIEPDVDHVVPLLNEIDPFAEEEESYLSLTESSFTTVTEMSYDDDESVIDLDHIILSINNHLTFSSDSEATCVSIV